MGAVSDQVILNRFCLFRGQLEIQEPSQKDQDQTNESGSHCMKVKPGGGGVKKRKKERKKVKPGMWKRQTRQTES